MPGEAEVRVPALGESIVEATVGTWLKHEGEAIEAGEPIVQLETEKVNVDVSADQSGRLASVTAKEGDTVHPGDVLATIEAGTAAAAAPPPTPTEVARPHASPVARRMAEEHGVDLSRIEGTGTGGRVTREDVERQIQPGQPVQRQEQPITPPSPDGHRPETHIRMTRRRQTIASRLLEAQRTAAMLTTFNEVDMTAIRFAKGPDSREVLRTLVVEVADRTGIEQRASQRGYRVSAAGVEFCGVRFQLAS